MSPTVTVASKPVGPIGYGLMGLTWRPNPQPADDSFRAMETALELGANCWNGGELYGTPERHSCHLLKEYFTLHPDHADKVVLNIKGGTVPWQLRPDGSAQNVRRSVEDCLKVLDGTKRIDVFECARVDPNVSLEETISTLGELVKKGKIGAVGLSEVKASTIERAAAIVPIASVEVELSLWTTDVLRNGVAETCARLGIPILAYSPLSRGALAGDGIRRNADIPEGDFRKMMPRFQDDVLEANNRLVDEITKLAARKGVTKAQIAVNWVRCLSGRTIGDVKLGTIIPIPGATTPARVTENSTVVDLTDDEMDEIAAILSQTPVKGDRYPEHGMALVEG